MAKALAELYASLEQAEVDQIVKAVASQQQPAVLPQPHAALKRRTAVYNTAFTVMQEQASSRSSAARAALIFRLGCRPRVHR
jgi:response regulator of citrate/malate metabolism